MSKTSTVTYQVKTVYFPSSIKSNEEKRIKLGLIKSVRLFLTCYLKSLKNAAMPSTNSFGLVNYIRGKIMLFMQTRAFEYCHINTFY